MMGQHHILEYCHQQSHHLQLCLHWSNVADLSPHSSLPSPERTQLSETETSYGIFMPTKESWGDQR
jgi:hypothetical protein